MKISKYTDAAKADLEQQFGAKQLPKPEPWLHIATSLERVERRQYDKHSKRFITTADYGLAFAIFVWDTRKVLAGGRMMVDGSVAGALIKSWPSAKDARTKLQGDYKLTAPFERFLK